MAYKSMKKLIDNANARLVEGTMSKEEYEVFKEDSLKKIDVFTKAGRLTDTQAKELKDMLK